MKFRQAMVATLCFAAACVQAQGQGAASTPKKDLVQKVLQLQQPAYEGMARALVEQPALQILQQAGAALQQRVPAERREAVAREIQADVRKYVDEAVPAVRERALVLAPATIGPLLEERFSEDELRQLIGILESPVNRKYQQLGGEMQKVLSERVVGETRASVEGRFRALEASVVKRLGLSPSQAPASAAASKPAAARK